MRDEMDGLLADIHESHADIDAGRVASVAETFAEVRKQLNCEWEKADDFCKNPRCHFLLRRFHSSDAVY